MEPFKCQLQMTTREIRQAGFHFCMGAIYCLALCLFIGMVINLLLRAADDCDRSWWDRCGMKVATDAKTGKQYLISPGGGIIERSTK